LAQDRPSLRVSDRRAPAALRGWPDAWASRRAARLADRHAGRETELIQYERETL